MGNNTSNLRETECGLSTIHETSYFQSKSITHLPIAPKKRKHSATSSASSVVKIEDDSIEILDNRKYLKLHRFYLPVDDQESDRLVILHFLVKFAFGGNLTAPVEQSLRINHQSKVLDIGCGAGTWILEMATEFPNTEFHGIDIRTMFPVTIKPKNAIFLQYDIIQERKLPYPDASFDFIRLRLMLAFMSEQEFLVLLSEIHRILKPMGYIEILDCEYQVYRPGYLTDAILNQQLKQLIFKEYGVDFFTCQQVSTLLMTHNLINIQQQVLKLPLGWGHPLGQTASENLCSFLSSLHPVKIKAQLNSTDFNAMLKECTDQQSHMNWFVCYAQKPNVDDNDSHSFIQDFLNEFTDD